MNLYTVPEPLHYVSVARGPHVRVTFECLGDDASDCRLHPVCACPQPLAEGHAHPPVWHETCALQAWFDRSVDDIAAAYRGLDGETYTSTDLPEHTGSIVHASSGDAPTWHWSDYHSGLHISRHWDGPGFLEEHCPCRKEACGFVAENHTSPLCMQHPSVHAKTMRSGHKPANCPARPH